MFSTLILDDDPMDGSRSLRKRKASSEGLDAHSKASSKRQRKEESEPSESEVPAPAVSDGEDEDEPVLAAAPRANRLPTRKS